MKSWDPRREEDQREHTEFLKERTGENEEKRWTQREIRLAASGANSRRSRRRISRKKRKKKEKGREA